MRLGLALVWVGGLGGCAHHAPRLGSIPQDQAVLADTPELQHLAAMLPADGPVDVAELIKSERWAFTGPPDPSAWLMAGVQGDTPTVEGAVGLRVLTYNTALLSRTYPGGAAIMPEVPTRAPLLPDLLLADGTWDVLLLQEVWEWSQVEGFAAAAERHGYLWYAGTPKRHEEHGLMMLVKKDLVAEDGAKSEVQFDAQRRIEHWPGPNIKRGYLTWTLVHAPTGRRLRIATSHPQAFPDYWQVRTLQARQLAVDLSQTPESTTVILGLDLNAGSYYPEDELGIYKDKPVTGWWRNSLTYPLIRHYGDFTDAMAVLEEPLDVAGMKALPAFSPEWLTTPLAGSCDDVPLAFTGTDCNPMYAANYIGEEYPARLDYVFFHASQQELRVVEAGIVYTDPLPFGDQMLVPSDHYGVGVTFELAPKP